MLIFTKIAVAGLSFWALTDNPYAYYQFLRITIFVVGAILAYKKYEANKEVDFWVCFYGLTALLWNPIFPVYMAKEAWSVFNVVVGIFYLVSILKDRQVQNKPKN